MRDVLVDVAALEVPLGVAGSAQAERLSVALADEGDEIGGEAEPAGGPFELVLARRADRPAAP